MVLNKDFVYFALLIIAAPSFLLAALDKEDCELHTSSTMHEFCCDIHDENGEFLDCQIEWSEKIHHTTEEQDMNFNFCLSELHGDDDSERLLYNTFLNCAEHATGMLQHETIKKLEKRLARYSCRPYSVLVFECVSNELILNCPPKKFRSTAQCDHAKEYLETCLVQKV